MRSCDALPSATTETTDAMPMMMPNMVNSDRILLARIEWIDMENDSVKLYRNSAKRPRFRFTGVGNDASVFDFDDAVGLTGDVRVVRDHDDRVTLTVQLLDDFHDGFAAFGIQRAGRFVGQNDFTAVHQRARDADALLLAAGQLVRFVAQPVAQIQIFQQFRRAGGASGLVNAGINGGQGGVFHRVQIG